MSRSVNRLSGSLRLGLFAEPTTDRAAGIVSLFNGEPDFPTPTWICEAATAAMQAGYTHYPPHQGDPQLRVEIAALLDETHGQSYTPDDILITNGATSAISSAIAAFVDPGDEVVILDPQYSLYEDVLNLVGAVPVRASLTGDLHLDAGAIEAVITPRTRMLVLCNPCNPTATVFSLGELAAIERLAVEHRLLVLSDEVYEHIVYDDRPFVSAIDLPELAERTLLVQSFSKSYAMTGWRLGFLAAKGGRARQAMTIQRTAIQQVNAIAQRAGVAALRAREQSRAWFEQMLREYDRRRTMAKALLDQAPRIQCAMPEGTFYLWARVDTSLTSVQLVKYLRDTGRVAIHAGTEYGPGGEGYVRLTFAASDEDIREGICRISQALSCLPD